MATLQSYGVAEFEDRAAEVAKRRPGGSNPGERRGGRAPGTPNRTTAIISAAMDAVAAKGVGNIDITPLEFLTGMMLDPNVDPNLRFKAAQAAAPYCHARPLASAPPPGDLVIETPVNDDPLFKIERAKVEAIERRIDELDALERFLEGTPLTRAEQSELADLETQLSSVPSYLKRMPEGDPELREFLEEDVWGLDAAQPASTCDAPDEYRKRLLSERQPPVERKAPPADDDDAACPPGKPVRHRSADGSISE